MATSNKQWHEILDSLKQRGAMPNRVLLYGPPGTGKSSWPHHAYNGKVYRKALSEGCTVDELLGQWTLRDGATVWQDGVAVMAMRQGCPLVIDEIDKASAEVCTILHAVCDDQSIAALHLPNGETVRPKDGFRVFATTNGRPEDLEEALRERFDLPLPCRTPAPDAIKTLTSPAHRKVVTNHYNSIVMAAYVRPLSLRALLAYEFITARGVEPDVAARAVFADGAEEFLSVVSSAAAR